MVYKVLRPNKEYQHFVPTTLQQIGSSQDGIGSAVGQVVNFD